MILKNGKEEIVYLLKKVIDKYKTETGKEIILNTNRKNYESIAILLSNISNDLPNKWEEFGTDFYEKETSNKNQEYPYRKYDITGGQIKDALNGIVSHPRTFLIDACYIYLFGVGRQTFEKNPTDDNLLVGFETESTENHIVTSQKTKNFEQEIHQLKRKNKSKSKLITAIVTFCTIALGVLGYAFLSATTKWQTLKTDMNILPYTPTKAEIDSLEGIWLCYTGSPQARISDPNRFHKVVPNLLNISYKNGYFTFIRYGASFNHTGYMQFESPGIISVYSRIKNNSGATESPRHSLINLHKNKDYLAAISASWNFDVGEKNKIIGIREVYTKLGKGGTTNEILNDVENASCNCKVIEWQQPNKTIKKIYLKNTLLDSLQPAFLKNLINEKSILESTPDDKLLLPDSSNHR